MARGRIKLRSRLRGKTKSRVKHSGRKIISESAGKKAYTKWKKAGKGTIPSIENAAHGQKGAAARRWWQNVQDNKQAAKMAKQAQAKSKGVSKRTITVSKTENAKFKQEYIKAQNERIANADKIIAKRPDKAKIFEKRKYEAQLAKKSAEKGALDGMTNQEIYQARKTLATNKTMSPQQLREKTQAKVAKKPVKVSKGKDLLDLSPKQVIDYQRRSVVIAKNEKRLAGAVDKHRSVFSKKLVKGSKEYRDLRNATNALKSKQKSLELKHELSHPQMMGIDARKVQTKIKPLTVGGDTGRGKKLSAQAKSDASGFVHGEGKAIRKVVKDNSGTRVITVGRRKPGFIDHKAIEHDAARLKTANDYRDDFQTFQDGVSVTGGIDDAPNFQNKPVTRGNFSDRMKRIDAAKAGDTRYSRALAKAQKEGFGDRGGPGSRGMNKSSIEKEIASLKQDLKVVSPSQRKVIEREIRDLQNLDKIQVKPIRVKRKRS